MDLPTYIMQDPQSLEYYNQELNQTLRDNLSNDGFVPPTLTNAEAAVIATFMPVGTFWYNSDLDKMQFLGSLAIQTITSV
jgi:hypothetical protein